MLNLLQELQETLNQEIPITQCLGITAEHYNGKCLILKAPLAQNINHTGSAFAGSLNALLTLAGWGQLWLVLKECNIPAKIVIQDSIVNYLLPVQRDFLASCYKPDPAQIARMQRMLQKGGRARIELQAEIPANNATAVSFKGRYVVLLTDK
jgi:thioesterase domain-containing protein